MIYHITNKTNWNSHQHGGSFKPDSLDIEGFIHCSPLEKIEEVANNFYKGQSNLILLIIDESKVNNKIVWEDLYGHNFNFPHIYGELNTDAVMGSVDLKCGKNGVFEFPVLTY